MLCMSVAFLVVESAESAGSIVVDVQHLQPCLKRAGYPLIRARILSDAGQTRRRPDVC